jgi:hypothetical protein
MNKKSSLEQVASAFKQWRISRLKREPVPEALIEQALQLLKMYSKNKIIKHLGINYKMLERWAQQRELNPQFVRLKPIPEKPTTKTLLTESCNITVRLPTGSELTMVGSDAQAVFLITQLQKGGVL